MGLFDSARAPLRDIRVEAQPIPDVKIPGSASSGGLFARGQDRLPWRTRLQGAAAALDDWRLGGNAFGGVMDDYARAQQQAEEQKRRDMEAEWQNIQRTRQQTQWGREDEQQAALTSWVASLPPEQQQIARANPGAALEAFMKTQQGGQWRVGPGYTNAFRTNPDGSTTIGGRLPTQPRQGSYGSVDDDGYDYVQE